MFRAIKGRGRGCWWPSAQEDGRLSATLYCPGCAGPHSLSAHAIMVNGVVSPSCAIPPHKSEQAECSTCEFHDHVTLVGWPQELADRCDASLCMQSRACQHAPCQSRGAISHVPVQGPSL